MHDINYKMLLHTIVGLLHVKLLTYKPPIITFAPQSGKSLEITSNCRW